MYPTIITDNLPTGYIIKEHFDTFTAYLTIEDGSPNGQDITVGNKRGYKSEAGARKAIAAHAGVEGIHISARWSLPNGLIVFRTITCEGHTNCVTLRKDGSYACMRDDEQCKGQKYSKEHSCCHIERCKWYEQENHPAQEKQAEKVSERDAALAAARAATNDLLEKIDAEVQATIESEQSAAPREKSEQAKIATLDEDRDESNEEARIQQMTDQALIEHAALNGNRKVQAPAGGASAIERRMAACGCLK